jgi:fatty-acyl-CoA synthase
MERLSVVKGTTNIPLIEITIGQFFDEVSRRHANVDALISCHQNARLTYAELRQKVDALACSLLRLGLTVGERVAIWSQNNEEWALTQFATAKAGFILVNVNPAYRLAELDHAINKVGCKAIVLSPSFKSSDHLKIVTELAPEIGTVEPGLLQAERLPSLKWVIRLGPEKTPGIVPRQHS